jgi:hypothetical protein
MDSDIESSMRLFSILPAASIMMAFLPFAMFGPMVLYIIARWRAHRTSTVDPQLGLKFALHWFATTAFQLALMGGVLLIWTIIRPGSGGKGDLYRVAFAMLVPAGIVLGVHVMLLRRTNDQEVPGVRRLFLGYNFIVTGLVGFMALVMGFQLLFMKGSTAPAGHLAGAAILVYCSAWGVLGHRLGQLVFGDWGGGRGLPDEVVPPQQQQPPASAAGGGGAGLPPLGGGSYPPIEPR